MPDLYAQLESLPDSAVQEIAAELEQLANDEQNQRFLDLYLMETPFPQDAHVLEIGCGTGAVARKIARLDSVAKVFALDVASTLLEVARGLSSEHQNLEFTHGNAHLLPWGSGEFDVVVFHTTLSHIENPGHALSEANRVLKQGGILLLFEADFSGFQLSNGPDDPLELLKTTTAKEAALDPWLVRRLPHLLASSGFVVEREQIFPYRITEASEHLLQWIDRGVDGLLERNLAGPVLASALKGEVRRRIALGYFQGQLSYSWIQGRKAWIDAGGGI